MENASQNVGVGGVGGIYFVRISARMFAPVLSFAAISPTRKAAGRLIAEFFDYRAAQNSGALKPREGEWESRPSVGLSGDLELTRPPSAAELPDTIFERAKLSWWPALVTFIWGDGGLAYQMLSARPPDA